MSAIVIFLAFLAASATVSNPIHEFTCVSSRRTCTLQNVVLESESELDRVTFPAIIDPLIIESGKIPHFTRRLAEKLAGIVDLAINRIHVETIYIKPEMTHLEATDNRIETLLVDNDHSKVYEMLTLDLTGNKLSSVEILSRFTKLRQLTLDRNSLEQLSMDVFGKMSELRKLSIANNQLFTVDTKNALQLVKLRSLSLAGNKMIELNVTEWELDSLAELDLSNNQLYLLDGSLGQFRALVDVKISKNYWKCEFLIKVNRLERLKFDHDRNDRCKEDSMADVKQICCTHDATSILGNTDDGALGLFNDKWEELRRLNESFVQLKNATEQNQQRIGQLEENNQATLIERIEQLEGEQKKIWEKLSDNQLESIVSDHKATIDNLESKQGDLASNLEGFVERLNSLRETVDDKFTAVGEVKEKMELLEANAKGNTVEVVEKKITALRDTFKNLEGQQVKYHLSSVDLKNQIGAERSRIAEVQEQYTQLLDDTQRLRYQMDIAQTDISRILNFLEQMNSDEA